MATNQPKIRVRFAPSPTGFLHVGGLRTALFNYLFAKSQKGDFILRIEDTDRERLVDGAAENLIKSLQSVGLMFDEGPGIGGKCAPYVQSERLEHYRTHTDLLLEKDRAYRCFCTSEELDAMREEQKRRKMQTRYTGKCRRLTPAEIEDRLKRGIPYTIRMKINYSAVEVVFNDLIRGRISIKTSQLEDQVLMKSDGYPTYHLANVVDDRLMGITHVIRGEEWLPSTPKHVLLYQYFDRTPPHFAHLPLLLNPDKSKLSKRQGDVATEDFLKKGYLPEALINFIALLGWNSGDDREIYSTDELIQEFSLEKIGKAGAVFDLQKLNWMNKSYIAKLTADELLERLTPYLNETYRSQDKIRLAEALALARGGLIKLSDINEKLDFLLNDGVEFTDPALRALVQTPDAKRIFSEFITEAEQLTDWNEQSITLIMKNIQKKTGIKGKDLWIPVRIAVSHEEHGPELPILSVFYGCNRQKQEQKNTEQSVHPAQEEVVKNEPADAETFEEVTPEEIARLNDTIKTQKLNTGEQIMQAYAPKEVSAEGNYSYTVSEASLSGTLKQITLTEEGLPDDSVVARKIIIIADYTTGQQ
ncbi:hypothetical protein CHS0354_002064 [Potamilus streckersoni]|uniref:Nondiscriminating glutamyl-tRNA synthetase EARS2, mitochondrial n=1 Tax=Potamilus streckersoni TaxID=2493646 RepID=A0AAE0T608_9BIVA|nr:hypothetical protein CHS0354_002064 [Potamilus streckersoni]